MIAQLRVWFARRARKWARRRQGSDRLPVTIDRRRVYILPTHLGVIYALALFAMLLASMNYNSSLGFALTFLLASVALVAMFHCHRNLTGIVVTGVTSEEAFAGSPLRLRFGCDNPGALPRHALTLEVDACATVVARIARAERFLIEIELPTERRGPLRPTRCVLSTRFPFGLFRAWSWLHAPLDALVYPKSSGNQSPPPTAHSDRGTVDSRQRGDDDFRGFREYVPGDSPRRVAWKAFARGGPLLVKDLAGAAHAPQIFTLESVHAGDLEARLSQITQWVIAAEQHSRSYGLALPTGRISAAAGAEHRRRCLTALALFELSSDDAA
jgi:uncharacterized protein (DUF58 family)